MVDEFASSWVARHEVRESVDRYLMETGEPLVAHLTARTPSSAVLENWGDDPANEQGNEALLRIAAQARV